MARPSAAADACKAKAYREGYNARMKGYTHNPYPSNTLLHSAWLEGYVQAGRDGWGPSIEWL